MTNATKNLTLPADTPLYFDDFITRDGWRTGRQSYPLQFVNLPATNVFETLDNFVIEIVAPGLSHEDLHIATTDSTLDIRYEPVQNSRFESLQTRRNWHTEYRALPFRRQFEMEEEAIDFSGMVVTSEHGRIQFVIPKKGDYRGRVAPFVPKFSLS